MKKIVIILSLAIMSSTVFAGELSEKVCLKLKASHEASIKQLNEAAQKGQLSEQELGSEISDLNTEAQLYNGICPTSVRFILIN